jgi:hypothetical protein
MTSEVMDTAFRFSDTAQIETTAEVFKGVTS